MRFCQSDGTPLVADVPLDPYKTMVARPEDIAASIPSASSDAPVPEPSKEGEVLELPAESDPLKTMYASEEEIRREMNARDVMEEPVMDIPPLAPEPPKFSEPSLSPPSFGDMSPPPSPFSPTPSPASPGSPFGQSTPAVPSPFSDPKPAAFNPPTPNFPAFKDPEPVVGTASSNPFDSPGAATPEWTPPPAIEPSLPNQGFAPNSPSQPDAAAGGQNKTLAIVSLVLSLLSIPCCGLIIVGIAGAITGFMAKGKADGNPAEYGGRSLALAAIVIGLLTTLVGIVTNALALLGVIPIPNF